MPVGVCGEMGGRPLEAMALIGIGVEKFSITPAAVGPIKAMIRSLDAAAVRAAIRSNCWTTRPQHAQDADRLGAAALGGDELMAGDLSPTVDTHGGSLRE